MVLFGSFFAINPAIRPAVRSMLNEAHNAGAWLYYDINFRKTHIADIPDVMPNIKNNIIEDVKFETFGCGSAIASSSMATELIKGKTIEDALAVTNRQVVDALGGLPAHKLHCSVLAEEAIKAAVKDYYDKNGIEYDHSKFPDCAGCDGGCCMV